MSKIPIKYSVKKSARSDLSLTTQGYVHYNASHINIKYMNTIYENKVLPLVGNKEMMVKNLIDSYKNRIMSRIHLITPEGKELFSYDDNTITDILSMAVRKLNTQMESEAEISKLAKGARTSAYSAFTSDKIDEKALRDFLEQIEAALKLTDNLTNPDDWKSFKTLFTAKILGTTEIQGTTIKLNQGTDIYFKACEMLNKMVERYGAGKLNKNSISGSISEIMHDGLGEIGLNEAANTLLEAALEKVDDTFGKIQSVGNKTRSSNTGSNQVKQKADATKSFGQGATFKFTRLDGQDYSLLFKGELDISDKIVTGFDKPGGDVKNYANQITLESAGSFIRNFEAAAGSLLSEYFVYNTMVFAGHTSKVPEILKYRGGLARAIIIKNLIDYIAGRDGEGVLLININGFFYPVFNILFHYMQHIKDTTEFEKNGIIYIKYDKFKSADNAWEFEPGNKNKKNRNKVLALQRSQKARTAAEALRFSLRLRGGALTTLATSGEQPWF